MFPTQVCIWVKGSLTRHTPRPHITLEESRAIRELRLDQSSIICTADKGVAMIVMDRQDYVNKAKELLADQDTYRPISKDPILKLTNHTNSNYQEL